jgi:hypothetical protein
MSLGEIHGRLGTTALYFFVILGVWGLWRYFRKQSVDSNYWGALAIGEILVVLQGLFGAYLWIIGERPGRSIHILYGVVTALVIPAVYAYTKGDEKRQVVLIYAASLLIGALLIVRAITTAMQIE